MRRGDQTTGRQKWPPLDRWPESRWRDVERSLGVAAPDAELRADICEAVAEYVAEPELPEGLYLDPRDGRRVTAKEARAIRKTFVCTARGAAKLGAQLTLPRGKETRLLHLLLRRWLPDYPEIVRDPSQPLKPAVLAVLARRAVRWRCVDPPGRRWNLAREHLVWRLKRAIEARCGEGSAKLGWSPEHDSGTGLLFAVTWELRQSLPGLEDATPRALYDWLYAMKRRRRASCRNPRRSRQNRSV